MHPGKCLAASLSVVEPGRSVNWSDLEYRWMMYNVSWQHLTIFKQRSETEKVFSCQQRSIFKLLAMDGTETPPIPLIGQRLPATSRASASSAGSGMVGANSVRGPDAEHLVLNPVTSKVRRIAVYETKTVSLFVCPSIALLVFESAAGTSRSMIHTCTFKQSKPPMQCLMPWPGDTFDTCNLWRLFHSMPHILPQCMQFVRKFKLFVAILLLVSAVSASFFKNTMKKTWVGKVHKGVVSPVPNSARMKVQ